MKKTLLLSLISIFTFTGIQAQNCEAYISTETGKKLMYKTTNKKGKIQSYYSQELLNKKNKDGGTVFEILNITYNENKEIEKQDTLEFMCKDNVFYIDMSSYLNEEQLKSYEESQIEINFDNIGYPTNLKPGATLKDGYVEAKINMGVVITFRTDIKNRKVESSENLTTEAGSFKTLKITEDIVSKIGFGNIRMSSISWISKNIGNIRSETYDKKGNLFSVSELISIE